MSFYEQYQKDLNDAITWLKNALGERVESIGPGRWRIASKNDYFLTKTFDFVELQAYVREQKQTPSLRCPKCYQPMILVEHGKSQYGHGTNYLCEPCQTGYLAHGLSTTKLD